MAANQFLLEHALENVWAQSTQDRQHVLKMARYTPASGSYRRVQIQRFFVDLPTATDGAMLWHHVFQIGATFPMLLSLKTIKNEWVRADEIATLHGVTINVFTESGTEAALCHCWLRQVSDGNILLAVEIRDKFNFGKEMVINDMQQQELVQRQLSSEDTYFRCYQNAKAQSSQWAATTPSDFKPLSYVYQQISSSANFTTFLNKVNAAKTSHGNLGKGRYYIDGFLVGTQNAYRANLHLGRLLTYVHDETVRYEGIVPFEGMGTFHSNVDAGQMKMLLLVGEAISDISINYHDDIDFYLVNHATINDLNGRGTYIGRVRRDIVRQVTQNAYSIRTASLQALIAEHAADHLIAGKVYIRYIVRDGGMRKGLPFNRERLNDLYRLPVDKIKEAMYGVNSVVPEWRAEYLEKTEYMKVVSSWYNQINTPMVSNGYGYHALMKVSFNEMVRPEAGIYKLAGGYLASPVRDNLNASMHRYDNNGLYLGPQNVLIQSRQHFDNQVNVASAEFINMPFSETEDGTYIDQDLTNADLNEYGFRAYVCSWHNGAPLFDWQDITGGIWYTYTVTNGIGEITWNFPLLDAANLYPAIRIQKLVHCYKFNLPVNYSGFVRFSIESLQKVAGSDVQRVQCIPSDSLDIFLNGKPLIENIDYYVKWPEVVIVKRFTTAPSSTEIYVRHYGLSLGSELDHRQPREAGFSKAGILSADSKYDLRNDRNIRIVVDGVIKTRNEVKFAEDSLGNVTLDGRPYSIQEYRFPMENFVSVPVKPLVMDAESIDERVSAYVTPYINENITERGFIDGERYQVVSPLISALLHAMVNFNFLNNGELDDVTITDLLIEELAAPYWSLLPYEPIFNQADVYYVNILPHQYTTPMEITARQYIFLEHIIHIYLKDSIDLTPTVKIKTVVT